MAEARTRMKEKQHLIGPLAYWLAAGKLDARSVLPAIEKLAEDSPKSLPALLEALEGETDEALVSLARHLRQTLRKEALNLYQAKRQGLPAGDTESMSGLALETVEEWRLAADPKEAVETAMKMSQDLAFFAANQDKAPRLFREIQHRTDKALANACAMITDLVERVPKPLLDRLVKGWADDLPGREQVSAKLEERRGVFRQKWLEQARRVVNNTPEPDELESAPAALAARFAAAASRDEKAGLLDLACCWMTPAAAPALEAMSAEAWAADRALWNLTLRFGKPENQTWEDWRRWLADQERRWQSEQETFGRLIDHQAPGLLLVLYSQLPNPDPAVLDALTRTVAESGKPVEPSERFASWSNWAPPHEIRALTGLAEPTPPVIASVGTLGVAARGGSQPPPLPAHLTAAPPVQPGTVPVQPAVAKVAPPVPAKPSLWEVHIQPFFQENWYIVAGIAMVILGSSLLAYYTWDKHWLVRYTLMPLLLAGFTWSLAWVGDWIEKKSAEFKGTAAILRGAAIGLLPINFMAMALLSSDEKVPEKTLPLLAMALIYLSVFGWGLRKWCMAVDQTLGTVLGGTLLLLNALVAVGPLAQTVGHLEGPSVFLCVGAGFYAGFAATVGAIVFFTKKILTRQMADEKRVPWFVAGALAITFLEVFIWVHGFMRHVPQAPTYALMVILTGWLILYAEGRALQLKESPHLHGGESFLGFGAILLGLLMGFGEPAVRVASFLTAGGVWMYQGLRRRHPLHDWIALTLLGLGGAAVGLSAAISRAVAAAAGGGAGAGIRAGGLDLWEARPGSSGSLRFRAGRGDTGKHGARRPVRVGSCLPGHAVGRADDYGADRPAGPMALSVRAAGHRRLAPSCGGADRLARIPGSTGAMAAREHGDPGAGAALCRVHGCGRPQRPSQQHGIRPGDPLLALAGRELDRAKTAAFAGPLNCVVALRHSGRGGHAAAGGLGRQRAGAALVSRLHGLRRAAPDDARLDTGRLFFQVTGAVRHGGGHHGGPVPGVESQHADHHPRAVLGHWIGQRSLGAGADVALFRAAALGVPERLARRGRFHGQGVFPRPAARPYFVHLARNGCGGLSPHPG